MSPWLALLLLPLGAVADDVWKEKPPAQWTPEERVEFLTNSPWANRVTVYHPFNLELVGRRPKGLPRPSPDAPVDDVNVYQLEHKGIYTASAIYVVRWSSAAIVQQALAQLEPALRTVQSPPSRLSAGHYVITVHTKRPPARPAQALFESMTKKQLFQGAELRTSRKLRLKPVRVVRHGLGASAGISFFFPRRHNGQAALPPKTKWAEFIFKGARGEKLKARFKLADMQVGGQLDY